MFVDKFRLFTIPCAIASFKVWSATVQDVADICGGIVGSEETWLYALVYVRRDFIEDIDFL
jgi:hypothetical protein